MFHVTHYIGDDILAHFQEGEQWREAFGRFFMLLEEAARPYEFVSSPHYLKTKERGSATGRLFVEDREMILFISGSLIPATHSYVCLSAERNAGTWQIEGKVQIDSNGNSTIKNVIPGVYGPESRFYSDNPTVRAIGFPDRTAIGYYIPDMNPAFICILDLIKLSK
ncbi:hypothetical protein P3X46_033449 [Hevea brasiliensis]|uniref:Uncharacterized protein n=1 Tax=Hevea brasiliensis TaxID=3981 RepID=A0ABQ9KHG6_HEVBR|nr:hypothetical protein P3X46_033449 [Hevea brasiliensis]